MDFLDKLNSYLIRGLIIISPLFFLPVGTEYYEYGKQLLLLCLAPLILLIWLSSQVAKGRVVWQRTPLDLILAAGLGVNILAAIFGLSGYFSWWGWYGRPIHAVISSACFLILFFLMNQTRSLKAGLREILPWMIGAWFSAAIWSALHFAVYQPYNLITGWQRIFIFVPIGNSLPVLGIVWGWLVVMGVGWAHLTLRSGARRAALIMAAISLLALAALNITSGWVFLLAAAAVYLITGYRKWPALRYWAFGGVLLSGAFLMLSYSGYSLLPAPNIVTQPNPSWTHSLRIALNTLEDRPALGSGPETYSMDHSRYREASDNYDPNWQIRFDHAGFEWAEILATTGLLGGAIWLLIIFFVYYFSRLFLSGPSPSGDFIQIENGDKYILLFLAALSGILACQFLAPFNMTALFLFWVTLAGLTSFWQHSIRMHRDIDLGRGSAFKLAAYSLVIVFFIGLVYLYSGALKKLAADIIYAGSKNDRAAMLAAADLNPQLPNYQIYLAQNYLDALYATSTPKPEDARGNILKAIEYAGRAAQLAPNYVASWEALAMAYQRIAPFARGSEDQAIKWLLRAQELEPANPVLMNETGKAYLSAGMHPEALTAFEAALRLKSDFNEAKLGLARALSANRREAEAVILLNELALAYPDAEVFFQLGRLRYNDGSFSEAIQYFQQAVKLNPWHANSLYSLGLALEASGRTAEALAYYHKVLLLNPANSDLEKRIAELEK